MTRKFGSFDDDEFGDAKFTSNPNSAFAEWLYCIRRVQAHFHAGDYVSAIEAATRAQRRTASGYLYQVADLHFYSALSHAAVCGAAGQQEPHLAALAAHHRQLQRWAELCPENFENRAALVGAEIARLEGRDVDAMRLYQQGIRSARVNSFVQNEALAYELAARFYAARGLDEVAQSICETPGTATCVGEPMARYGSSTRSIRTSGRTSRRPVRRARSGRRSNISISRPCSTSHGPSPAKSSWKS